MEKKQLLPLTRFDRNVAENILDFSIFKRDANLVKDVAFFFSHDHQHRISQEDLFGRKILIPEHFAQVVGRKDYRSLLNPHPEPAQLNEKKFSGLSPEELKSVKKNSKTADGEPLYDSWLDNALYRCRYESLRFSKKGKTPDGFTTSELSEIKFLKHLKKMYHPKTRQIYYEYELDETFENDLARYFLKFDFAVYKELEKPSYQDFYIALITIRDRFNTSNMPAIRVEWQFDKLCEISRTNCAMPEDRKKHINKCIKEINALHGSNFVSIDWELNGRFKYKPILNFTLSEKELSERQTEAMSRFNHFVLINLKAKFRENFKMITDETQWREQFIKWLRSPDWLFELKHSVALNTHVQCFGKMPQNKATKQDDPWDNAFISYIKDDIPKMAEKPLF